jgi:hypothetical protein
LYESQFWRGFARHASRLPKYDRLGEEAGRTSKDDQPP